MTENHPFDRRKLQQNRINFFKTENNSAGFLVDFSLKDLVERLEFIKRDFPLALQIGARTSQNLIGVAGIEKCIKMDFGLYDDVRYGVVADEEYLPFGQNVFYLVLTPLSLHHVNDLPGVLAQIQYTLKPDGLFLGALLGGETLHELRHAMSLAEIDICGGISPRIAPMVDKLQAGALLQRAGFSLPVVDSDILTVTYDTPRALMRDLKQMGEGSVLTGRIKHFSSRKFFNRVDEIYHDLYAEPDGRIRANFEIIYMNGWAPHESQQKPLPRGSAEHSLVEHLEGRAQVC